MELENTKEEQLTIGEFIIPSNIEGHDMMRLSPLLKFDFYDLSRKGIPIKRVIISEGIRELPIKCFYGIDNIETVILPTTCHDITPSCFELSSIRSVISSDNVCVIGEKAFKSSSINHFDWPASCEKIPFKCFWGPSLVDISFRGDITTIYKGAFACSTIEKFVWPEKSKVIPDSCFAMCRKLSDIKFPSYVEKLYFSAFRSCFALSKIDFSTSWYITILDNIKFIDSNSIAKK